MIFRFFSIFILVVTSPLVIATETKRIVHNDGTVEYTNRKLEGDKTIVYKSHEDGLLTISNIKPKAGDYEIFSFTCYACSPKSTINWYNIRLNTHAYTSYINAAAAYYDVDPALVRALIHAESAFNPKALSKAGARGLMQLMPMTAKDLGVDDSFNPEQNIHGGAKYIAQLLKQFNGNITLATAAYNAGPGAVRKYNGVPPYKETQVYVKRVAILHSRYAQ